MFLLPLRSSRAHPCTANHQKKNGAAHQKGSHHSYEVSLAHHGETRASPSPLENQTYPPPAASPPVPILGMGPISSEATTCTVRGSTRTSRTSLTWTIAH